MNTVSQLQNEKLLIAGGTLDRSTMIKAAEVYDSRDDTWTTVGSIKYERLYHTATVLPNGQVLITGGNLGFPSTVSFNSTELYDPIKGIWSDSGDMYSYRCYHAACLLSNGTVLLSGGLRNGGYSQNTAELYTFFK